MQKESWRRGRGGGVVEEESGRRSHGGGILEEKLWRGNHGGCILDRASWRRSPRNHQEAPRSYTAGTQEALRRQPGGTQETPRAPKAPEASEREKYQPVPAKVQENLVFQFHEGVLRVDAMLLFLYQDKCSPAAVTDPANLSRP